VNMSPTEQPALLVENVAKQFPGQLALDDVSLTVVPGEVHALLGENGSGKSTLIKILAGYHVADPGGTVVAAGTALIPGSPVSSHNAGLRFVHQHLAVVPELSAVENVALVTRYTRGGWIDWPVQEALTRKLLARLRVTMDIRRPLSECKPVERTAVAIARALYVSGDERVALIVLDEPTSSLAAPDAAELFRVIRELTAQGVAFLYVTHRLDEVFAIADRVSVLRDGRMQGTELVATLPRERLIEMIVGQRRADVAVRHEAPPVDAGAEELLRTEGLAAGRLIGLDLSLLAGEVVGVVGVTGSGREDVARALIGAVPVTAGAVTVRGERMLRWGPRAARDNGVMLSLSNTHAASALPDFDIRENVTLSSLLRYSRRGRIRRARERDEVDRWIATLDIRPREQARPYRLLSGGNQQKVILARSLSATPAVLVLDEPTAGVDVGARRSIYDFIAQEARTGLAVVLCSSDLEDVISVCDRVLVIREGSVVAQARCAGLDEAALLTLAIGDADVAQPDANAFSAINDETGSRT
jgi:ribose transport system ATP-binding protein